MTTNPGPLAGLRVLEFASIGPGPHCAMLLADMGADVVRIEREGGNGWPNPVADRGRSVLVLDIRSEAGRERCLQLAEEADVLIEGFRPGVMERLGLGPEVLRARNPRLVYGRMTGWGQSGPLARAAGHDINYIALTGALAAIGGGAGTAIPPLNLVGDFGGGSMFLAFGIMTALWERERSGQGQVVDAAIVDGVSSLMSFFAGSSLSLARERNLLGGAAPYYRCYTCADGREIALGPLEPQFFSELLERIGAPASLYEGREDPANWAAHAQCLAELFATRPQAEWCALLEGSDACFAPVLTLDEAPQHEHMQARGVYQELDGRLQVAPAPRLSRTPGQARPSVRLQADAAVWGERAGDVNAR
ncbi:CaiB/BaiF CoA transferase family protein [Geopseudomonas aromaticivorans]